MDADLAGRLVDCAQSVLQAETNEPVTIGRVSALGSPYTSQHITALIGVAGSLEGVMIFGFSQETARALVSHMVGQDIDDSDELIYSGVAELGNVIAGTALTDISSRGYFCTISPPTLIIGSGTIISTIKIPRLVFPLTTAQGVVEMQLALVPNTNCVRMRPVFH